MSLQEKRDELIQRLIAYKKLKKHEITVVFDGWKSGGRSQTENIIGGIRTIYSRLGDKADEVIKKLIIDKKKDCIVVTSDRDIAAHAWSHGAVPVSSERFLRLIENQASDSFDRTYRKQQDKVSGKGNPRQLSKKEKALMRALNKL